MRWYRGSCRARWTASSHSLWKLRNRFNKLILITIISKVRTSLRIRLMAVKDKKKRISTNLSVRLSTAQADPKLALLWLGMAVRTPLRWGSSMVWPPETLKRSLKGKLWVHTTEIGWRLHMDWDSSKKIPKTWIQRLQGRRLGCWVYRSKISPRQGCTGTFHSSTSPPTPVQTWNQDCIAQSSKTSTTILKSLTVQAPANRI